jgi:inosine-uridine nucleoside N-ribohydrolase
MTDQKLLKPIPVILDTDIGWDIDDTWALITLLNSPELDIRMVLTSTGNTPLRAKLVAKLLEVAGRTDIPVGIGMHQDDNFNMQDDWVDGYSLRHYPGRIYAEGVSTLVNMLMGAPEPVTLISIAPLPNIAAALELEPRITQHARFVGMHGSLRLGYAGIASPTAEYNVKVDVPACRKVFSAPWDITITPLDTCGLVSLHGEKYRRVRDSGTPLTKALMANVRIWGRNITPEWRGNLDMETDSSTLFDTVAVYLAFSEELLQMEKLGIRITDDGETVIDDQAKKIHCATHWKDLAAFEDLLVKRVIGAG